MLSDLVYLLALAPGLAAANPVAPRAATSTVTGYAHPLTLYPLSSATSAQSALVYASPPTAIPAPGADEAAAMNKDADSDNDKVLATPTPTTSSTGPSCTSIAGSSPTYSLPAFCHPSLMVNAPSLIASPSATSAASSSSADDSVDAAAAPVLAEKTIMMVSSKLECCAQCSWVSNCVAWKFIPTYVGTPTADLPGGFDPFARGNCKVVYETSSSSSSSTASEEEAAVLPNSCPNGSPGSVLTGGSNNGDEGGEDKWMNVYYNGWNEGQCGKPVDVFRKGYTDSGVGDVDGLCPGSPGASS